MTAASFLGTALVLGSLGVAALASLAAGVAPELKLGLYRRGVICGVALLALEIGPFRRRAEHGARAAGHVGSDEAAGDARSGGLEHGRTRGVRLALAVAAVGLTALLASGSAERAAGAIAGSAFAAFLVSEALGRMSFYESRDRLGV